MAIGLGNSSYEKEEKQRQWDNMKILNTYIMGHAVKDRQKAQKIYLEKLWLKTSSNKDRGQNVDAESTEGSSKFQQKENIKATEL